MFAWKKHEVCVAEGPERALVLLAIRPRRIDVINGRPGEQTVVWDDGSHQRAFGVEEVLTDESDEFRFRDDRGQVFRLRPMTADLYAAKVRAEVRGPELPTDAAVQAHYLQPRAW